MLESRILASDRESATWQVKSTANNIGLPQYNQKSMSAMRPGIKIINYFTNNFNIKWYVINTYL